MRFRRHRGGLDDSMLSCVQLPDRAALVKHVESVCGLNVDPAKLHVEPYGYDNRIGWDTHIVTIDGYGVAGFTDGPVSADGGRG